MSVVRPRFLEIPIRWHQEVKQREDDPMFTKSEDAGSTYKSDTTIETLHQEVVEFGKVKTPPDAFDNISKDSPPRYEAEPFHWQAVPDSYETNSCLPLFNIEMEGDPKISWFMYYDFLVTETEAFYQLQPGYLPTDKHPLLWQPGSNINNGKRIHPCGVLNCKSKPFTRHYDLYQHFILKHKHGQEKMDRNGSSFQFKGHVREHYREYHTEDLIKDGKDFQSVKNFPSGHLCNDDHNFWTCCNCLQRVKLTRHGYSCPDCKIAYDPLGVTLEGRTTILKDIGCDNRATRGLRSETETLMKSQVKGWRGYGISKTRKVLRRNHLLKSNFMEYWCLFWYRAFLSVSVIAGCSMFISFLWLSRRTKLEIPSKLVQQFMATSEKAIPARVIEASYLVPSGMILLAHILISALWSISAVGWGATRLRRCCLGYLYIYILAAISLWSLQGITAAELFLAFLPLSISVGICLYSAAVTCHQICKRAPNDHDRRKHSHSTALLSKCDQRSCKWASETSQQDFEINTKV